MLDYAECRTRLRVPRTSSSQRGVYVVLVPSVLIALFGLIGLTLTSGYAFTDRSKLQNLLDAMALAGATQVNMMNARALANQQYKCAAPPVSPPTGELGVRRAVLNVLLYTAATPGNEALGAAIAEEDVIIQYATRLSAGDFSTACPQTDSSQPIYVRIRLRQPIDTPIGFSDFLMGIIQPWLVDERYDLRISGSAVAGPAAAAPVWGDRRCPFPIYLCDRSTEPDPACDELPNGDECQFGYRKYWEAAFQRDGAFGCLPLEKAGLLEPTESFLQLAASPAANPLAEALAGVPGACPMPPDGSGRVALAPNLPLTPVAWDALRGSFNTRFFSQNQADWPSGLWPSDLPGVPGVQVDAGTAPADFSAPARDTVSAAWGAWQTAAAGAGIGTGGLSCKAQGEQTPNRDLAKAYIREMTAVPSTSPTQPLRRVVSVPVVDCPNGVVDSSPLVKGYACVLLTRPMFNDPDADSSGADVGQIIDAGLVQGLCGASTVIGRSDSRPPVSGQLPLSGQLPPLWRIVLYKTPGAGDS